MPNSEHFRANPYTSVYTAAPLSTMLLREPVPTASTCVITSATIKVRESYYKLDSHTDTCIFGRDTLIFMISIDQLMYKDTTQDWAHLSTKL